MTIIIDQVVWFRDLRGQDMNCDFSYLVIHPDGNTETREACGQDLKDRVKADFPDATFLSRQVTMSHVEGRPEKSELNGDLDALRLSHPEAHAILISRFKKVAS